MKRNNFHTNQRIKRKKEFKNLYEKSFRIYGGSFVYRFVFSNHTRLGISISKKFGNAVYRNRIKRLIREEFRHKDFPYPIDLLISQSKPLKKDLRLELKLVFDMLSDHYLLQQCSVQSMALSTIQFSRSMSFMAKILFYVILFYRRNISANLTASCRFTPSCSIYALEVLRVYPLWKAIYLASKRILLCNPLGGQGYDPVPKNKCSIKKARE